MNQNTLPKYLDASTLNHISHYSEFISQIELWFKVPKFSIFQQYQVQICIGDRQKIWNIFCFHSIGFLNPWVSNWGVQIVFFLENDYLVKCVSMGCVVEKIWPVTMLISLIISSNPLTDFIFQFLPFFS